MVRQDPIDPQRDYSNHMSPSPTAETAQIGQVDGEYEKKRKCAAPSICSTQSGVIFGNTHLGSDYIELICSMNCGDILRWNKCNTFKRATSLHRAFCTSESELYHEIFGDLSIKSCIQVMSIKL